MAETTSTGVELLSPVTPEQETLLTPEALEFFGTLHREFNARRLKLLEARKVRQQAIDDGWMPDFPEETASIRDQEWRVDPPPPDFLDRRVEITGPVDRKMIINALNSDAKCFMADFEDANAPTWANTLDGQFNLRDAVRGTITFTSPEGKLYALKEKPATLIVRPRGWHLPEKHICVDGEVASASLFDFSLYFFHNVRERLEQGKGLYLYLPKLEHYLEARLWNDVFVKAQTLLKVPVGTVKATVLIEHILAAFQMDEILYELRHHSAGLNCGRWDYIFSYIKKFAKKEAFLVPDRAAVTMTTPFMKAYSELTIKICHHRGAFAMGGMAAQIPIRDDPAANEAALEKVRQDKEREANAGHDGTWVAHPGLAAIALEEFDRVLGTHPNQIDKRRDDVHVTREDMLAIPEGVITEAGLRQNIGVGIQYLESWLGGNGCVPLYNLMEDAATAEISRTQLWQWVHNPQAKLDDGRDISEELVSDLTTEVLAQVRAEIGNERFDSGHFPAARRLFDEMTASAELAEFLTLKAYEELVG